MNLQDLEFAAQVIFRLCAEHPEICPHHYNWTSSSFNKETKMYTHHYICSLCGTERIEENDKSCAW